MSKDTFYFSHDYNARNDAKIKKLISKHGFLGYGIFWAIIEDLYNNTNVLPTDYESIAFDLRTDKEKIESIVTEFGLFVFEGDSFGSLSVQKRLEERNAKSEKARNSVLKRWANKGTDTVVLQTKYDSNTIKESILKENKINNSSLNLEIFDNFRKIYLGTKRGNETEFNNFKKHKDWESVLPTLTDLLNSQIKNRALKKQRGEFVPEWKNLQTWINNRCWEEVVEEFKIENKSIYSHIPKI